MGDGDVSEGTAETPAGPLRTLATGHGPAVLLIHGMASDAQAWLPAARDLAARGARVLLYDRRGYGGSPAPQPYGATSVAEQAQDALAVLDALGAPTAIVAGDGFGALVALEVLLRHPRRVAGIAVANPLLLQFAPQGADWLAATQMQLQANVRDVGPAAAVELWLGGRADPEATARARASAGAFFADWVGLASLQLTRGQLRRAEVPAAVGAHPMAPPHIASGAQALVELLPDVRAIDGELPAAVAALV